MVHTVLILGASGMLGSMLVDFLSKHSDFCLTASVRDEVLLESFQGRYPAVRWVRFDYNASDGRADFRIFAGQQWIINAVGITKPLIDENDPAKIETAIAVNSLLPHEIGRQAARTGAHVLQIATDCVYSGLRGAYQESDPHDARDVYGKTKSLGETWQPNTHHLRCSIIGPEPKQFKFLLEWFRRQPPGATVNGFVNHHWNGVSTLHFARICKGVIEHGLALPHVQHLVPCQPITKAGMLHAFAEAFGPRDIQITDVEANCVVDRTLSTINPELNERLWRAAGYSRLPSVAEIIFELARYDYSAGLGRQGALT
jgi:dTDP-4-dehydrorhamnose reductase